MKAAYVAHGFKSFRQAEYRTGVGFSVIHRMCKGMVPSKAIVVQWATAIGEPVNKWLALAGYEPLPGEGTNDITSDPEGAEESGGSSLRLRHPEPPPEVLEAIREAPTREAKVRQAIAYLQRPELRLRFGSDGGESIEVLIQIVRTYERLAGVQLLPPDVV